MLNRVNESFVVLDACVLAPMPICDTLLRLGYSQSQVDRRISAMLAAFEDSLVVGYEGLVPSMTNDEKDRHVLAAAVLCGAGTIVTENLKHFPQRSVESLGIRVLGCDDFLVGLFDVDPVRVFKIAGRQVAAKSEQIYDLMERLSRHAPRFVAFLRTLA